MTNSDQKESDALGQGPETCLDGVHRISCLKAPFMMQEVNTLFQFSWDGSPGEVLKKKKWSTMMVLMERGEGDVQYEVTFGTNLSSWRKIRKPGSGIVTAVGVRALARNCWNHDPPSNLGSKCRPSSLVRDPVWEEKARYWDQEGHVRSLEML